MPDLIAAIALLLASAMFYGVYGVAREFATAAHYGRFIIACTDGECF